MQAAEARWKVVIQEVEFLHSLELSLDAGRKSRVDSYMKNKRTMAVVAACLAAFVLSTTLAACNPVSGGGTTTSSQRLISLSPGVTEILYGIGAFSSLVADSDYCDYPEAAKHLPHVGGFFTINLEAVAGFHPTLIIITQDQAAFFKDKFDQMGLKVLVIKNARVDDVVESIRTIGNAIGYADAARQLADSIAAHVTQRAVQTKSLPHPKVLCVIDHLPGTLKDIYVASDDSFIGDMIAASGGQCLSVPNQNGYAKIQQEAIVDYNPEILIDVVHKTGPNTVPENTEIWRQLPQVTAVKSGRVICVSEPYLVHPSQLLVDSLDALSKMIHPEVFGAYE
jgi:iron complex transport system substrate-binding protein